MVDFHACARRNISEGLAFADGQWLINEESERLAVARLHARKVVLKFRPDLGECRRRRGEIGSSDPAQSVFAAYDILQAIRTTERMLRVNSVIALHVQ